MAVRPEGEQRFGRYRLVEMLGEGGMAIVYRAVVDGPEGFARQVVLKRILPRLSSNPKFVNMFLAEARLCALLHHPSIVQVHDLGEIGGDYFLAMEYVDGLDLATVMSRASHNRRVMPPGVACQLALQIADALGYAHGLEDAEHRPLEIVHRDVSPSNIMITTQGVAKLLDFGIAKVAAHAAAEHTRTGTLKGKVSYMSPEQAEGTAVDRRTDIFALGIVLWECLTGERLFGGTGDEMETLLRVREAKIWPPSSVRPDIEPDIDAVVMRMLAKTPEARFQSCAEVMSALRPIVHRLDADSTSLREFVASTATANDSPVPAAPRDVTTPARRKTPDAPNKPDLVAGQAPAREPENSHLVGGKAPAGGPAPTAAQPDLVGGLDAPVGQSQPVARASVLRPVLMGAAVLVMVGTGVALSMRGPKGAPPLEVVPPRPVERRARAPGPLRMAVVQFKNLGGDADLGFLVEGIGDTIAVKLAAMHGQLKLIERNQIAQAMKEIDFGRTEYADRETAIQLGRLTGAEVVVLGGFQRASGQLRATARFVDTADGEVLEARVATGAADAPFALQDAIAAEVRSAAEKLAPQGK